MKHTVDIPVSDILVIDDHSIVVEGFKELLKKILPAGSEVDVLTSIEKAKSYLSGYHYDFVITDLIMPGQNASEFIVYLRKTYPKIIILVLSSVIEVSRIKDCLASGANAYISKASGPEEIKLALENTYKGKIFISSDLGGRIAGSILSVEDASLTKKEQEVLHLIVAGHKTRQVAEMLHVSPVTVLTHKRSIMRKLELHSTVELIKYAYDNQII